MSSYVPALNQWYRWDGEFCVFEDGVTYHPREMQTLSQRREAPEDLAFIHNVKKVFSGEIVPQGSSWESPFVPKLTVAQARERDIQRIARSGKVAAFDELKPFCKCCGGNAFRVAEKRFSTKTGQRGSHYGIYCRPCNLWHKWTDKDTLWALSMSGFYVIPRNLLLPMEPKRAPEAVQTTLCTCGPSGPDPACPLHGEFNGVREF